MLLLEQLVYKEQSEYFIMSLSSMEDFRSLPEGSCDDTVIYFTHISVNSWHYGNKCTCCPLFH